MAEQQAKIKAAREKAAARASDAGTVGDKNEIIRGETGSSEECAKLKEVIAAAQREDVKLELAENEGICTPEDKDSSSTSQREVVPQPEKLTDYSHEKTDSSSTDEGFQESPPPREHTRSRV